MPRRIIPRRRGFAFLVGGLLTILFVTFLLKLSPPAGTLQAYHQTKLVNTPTAPSTEAPRTRPLRHRREWRTLSKAYQQEYIRAVQCLHKAPSVIQPPNGPPRCTLGDDFAYLRATEGAKTIGYAPFLPWNRFLLHHYERLLYEVCDYRGEGLVYWDWTLDEREFTKRHKFKIWLDYDMPVFKASAFGGTAQRSYEDGYGEIVYNVRSGPIQNLTLSFKGDEWVPHALRRWFRLLDSPVVTNRFIQRMMAVTAYEDFNAAIQQIDGNVSRAIGGDFALSSAPGDPLYMLHLAQLDRLWWIWQELRGTSHNDPKNYRNHHMYSGIRNSSGTLAKDTNDLFMPKLDPHGTWVLDMLETRNGCEEDVLCSELGCVRYGLNCFVYEDPGYLWTWASNLAALLSAWGIT